MKKINASAVWGPAEAWGALGPGPPGPLDKTALVLWLGLGLGLLFRVLGKGSDS